MFKQKKNNRKSEKNIEKQIQTIGKQRKYLCKKRAKYWKTEKVQLANRKKHI